MTLEHDIEHLRSLVLELIKLPAEAEWVEFKHNKIKPEDLGKYISALANAAALVGKPHAYMVWGIEDDTHEVLGTDFKPLTARHKQQELESWLLQKTAPKILFRFFEVEIDDKAVVLMEVQAASHTPVKFDGVEYLRIGSYKKKLSEFPEKERELWRSFDRIPFEQQSAASNQSAEQVLALLDYPAYFSLMKLPLPENRDGILARLAEDRLITKNDAGSWNITNLGAILFAYRLKDFAHLERKAVRLIQYQGDNRIQTVRELEGNKGYAAGFEGLIDYITTLLPKNEVMGQALRETVPMYPDLAVRELVANAIIHQDLAMTGTGPTIELFATRMEITNPGIPLVDKQRFLDSPPRSRNEALASLMRRIGICEERGSGIDKVVFQTEFYQLPAPDFEVTEQHTRAVLFAHKDLNKMDKDERIRACYFHCCLRYVNREHTNNQSVRQRFGIEEKNKAQASRIIKQATEAKLIRPYDPAAGAKSMRYIPFWA